MIEDQLFGNNPSYALARGITDNVSPQPQLQQTEGGSVDNNLSDEQLLQTLNAPLSGQEVAEKIAYLNQNGIAVNKNTISFEEWDKYNDWHKTQSTNFWEALGEGAKHAGGELLGGAWAAATDWKKLAAATGLSVAASPLIGFGAVYGQTLAEGAARGARDLAGLFVMAFNNPDSPLYRLTTHQGDKKAMYQDFMDLADWNQKSMDIVSGKSNLLMPDKATYEKLLGKPMGDTVHDFFGVNHELATAASYILDPVTLLSLGGGKIAEMAGISLLKGGQAGKLAQAGAAASQAKASFLSQGLLHAGTFAERAGGAVARPFEKAWMGVHGVLDDIFGKNAVRMSQTGVKARKITPGVPPGSLAHALLAAGGTYGLFHIPYGGTIASIYGAAKALELGGNLGKNLGKVMVQGGKGFFESARMLNAGYSAANGGGKLVAGAIDKSEVMAGYFKEVGTHAIKGSLFGGAIGYASAGEEGLAGGLGGGIVIGAAAHNVGLAYGTASGAFRKQRVMKDFQTMQDEHTKGGFINQRDNINKLVARVTADHGDEAGLRAMAHILKVVQAEGTVTTFLDTASIVEALKADPSSHPYLYALDAEGKPLLDANGERVLSDFGKDIVAGGQGKWNGMFTHADPVTGEKAEKPYAIWNDGRTGNRHIVINVDGFVYDRDMAGNILFDYSAKPVARDSTDYSHIGDKSGKLTPEERSLYDFRLKINEARRGKLSLGSREEWTKLSEEQKKEIIKNQNLSTLTEEHLNAVLDEHFSQREKLSDIKNKSSEIDKEYQQKLDEFNKRMGEAKSDNERQKIKEEKDKWLNENERPSDAARRTIENPNDITADEHNEFLSADKSSRKEMIAEFRKKYGNEIVDRYLSELGIKKESTTTRTIYQEGPRPTAVVEDTTPRFVREEMGQESGIQRKGKLGKTRLPGPGAPKTVELQGPGAPVPFGEGTDIRIRQTPSRALASRNSVLEEMFHMFGHIQREIYGKSVRDDVRGWFLGDGLNKGKLETEKDAAVDLLHKAIDKVVTGKSAQANDARVRMKAMISDIANGKIGPHNVGEMDVVFEELAAKMFLGWEEGKPFDYIFRDGDMGLVQNLFSVLKDKYAQHVLREAGQLGANIRTEQHFTEWFSKKRGSQFRFDATLDRSFKNAMRVFRDHGLKNAGNDKYKIAAMSIPKLTALAQEQGYEHLLAKDDQGNVTGMKPLEQINKEQHERAQSALRELIAEGVKDPEILNGLDIIFSDRRNDKTIIGESTLDEIASEAGRSGRTFFQSGDPEAFGPGLDDLRQAQQDQPSTGQLPPQDPALFGARGRPRTTLGGKSRLRKDIINQLNQQLYAFNKKGGTLIMRGVPGEKAFRILEKHLPKNVSANIRAMSMPIFDGGKNTHNVMNAVYHGFTQNIDGHIAIREHGDTFTPRNITFVPYEMDIRVSFRNPKTAAYDYKEPHFTAVARVFDLDVLQRRINTLWEEDNKGLSRLYGDKTDFENHVYETISRYASEKSIPAREFFGEDKESWSRRNYVMAALGAFPNKEAKAGFSGILDQDWHRFLSRKDELNQNEYMNPWTRLRLDNMRGVAAVDKSRAKIPFTEKTYYRGQVPTPKGINERFYERGSLRQRMYQAGEEIAVETYSAKGLLEENGIDVSKFKSDQAIQAAAGKLIGDPLKLYRTIASHPDYRERPNPVELFQKAEEYGYTSERDREFLGGNFQYASENLGDVFLSEAIKRFILKTAGPEAEILKANLDEHLAMGGSARDYNGSFVTGKPVVVTAFHGTPSEELGNTRTFDPKKLGGQTGVYSAKEAQWNAGTRKTAESYAYRGLKLKTKVDKIDSLFSEIYGTLKTSILGNLGESNITGALKVSLENHADFMYGMDVKNWDKNLTPSEFSQNIKHNSSTLRMYLNEVKAQLDKKDKAAWADVNKLEKLQKELSKIDFEEDMGPVLQTLVAFKNPLVYDYQGAEYSEASKPQMRGHPGLADLIKQARKEGRDGVVALNLIDGGDVDNHYAVLSENIGTNIVTLPSQKRTGYPILRGLNGNEHQSLYQAGEELPRGIFGTPNAETAIISDEYRTRKGITLPKGAPIIKLNEQKSYEIGRLYDEMKSTPNDPLTRAAYKAMADETLDQYRSILARGYRVEMYGEKAEPYKNSSEMLADLRNNKHLYIFPTGDAFGGSAENIKDYEGHPLLADSGFKDINGKPMLVNDVFRFVHDFFGHSELGNSFGAIGEENAWDVHSRMYSPLARRAMTSETRGQNSWVNFFNKNNRAKNEILKLARKAEDQGNHAGAKELRQRVEKMGGIEFAPQKVGLLPEWASKLDDEYTPAERAQRGSHKTLYQEGEVKWEGGEYKYTNDESQLVGKSVEDELQISEEEKRMAGIGKSKSIEESLTERQEGRSISSDEDESVVGEETVGMRSRIETEEQTSQSSEGEDLTIKQSIGDAKKAIDDYIKIADLRRSMSGKSQAEINFEVEKLIRQINKERGPEGVKISRLNVDEYSLRVGGKKYTIDQLTPEVRDMYIKEKFASKTEKVNKAKQRVKKPEPVKAKEDIKETQTIEQETKPAQVIKPETKVGNEEKAKIIDERDIAIEAARRIIQERYNYDMFESSTMTKEQAYNTAKAILETEMGMHEENIVAHEFITDIDTNLEVILRKELLSPESIKKLSEEFDIEEFSDNDEIILPVEAIERLGIEWNENFYAGDNPAYRSVFQDYLRSILPEKQDKIGGTRKESETLFFEKETETWQYLKGLANEFMKSKYEDESKYSSKLPTKTVARELYGPWIPEKIDLSQRGWSVEGLSDNVTGFDEIISLHPEIVENVEWPMVEFEVPITAAEHLRNLRDAAARKRDFYTKYNKLVDLVKIKNPSLPNLKKIESLLDVDAKEYIKKERLAHDFFERRMYDMLQFVRGEISELPPIKEKRSMSVDGYIELTHAVLAHDWMDAIADVINNPDNPNHGLRDTYLAEIRAEKQNKGIRDNTIAITKDGKVVIGDIIKIARKGESPTKITHYFDIDFFKRVLGDEYIKKEVVKMIYGINSEKILSNPDTPVELRDYISGKTTKLPYTKEMIAARAAFDAENTADAISGRYDELTEGVGKTKSGEPWNWVDEDWSDIVSEIARSPEGATKDGVTAEMLGSEIPAEIRLKRQKYVDAWNKENAKGIAKGITQRTAETISDSEIMAIAYKSKKQGIKLYDENGKYIGNKKVNELTLDDKAAAYDAAYNQAKPLLRNPQLFDKASPEVLAEVESALLQKIQQHGANAELTPQEVKALKAKSDNLTVEGGKTRDGQYSVEDKINPDGSTSKVVVKNATEASPYTGQPEAEQVVAKVDTEAQALAAIRKHDEDTRTAVEAVTGQPTKNPLSSDVKQYDPQQVAQVLRQANEIDKEQPPAPAPAPRKQEAPAPRKVETPAPAPERTPAAPSAKQPPAMSPQLTQGVGTSYESTLGKYEPRVKQSTEGASAPQSKKPVAPQETKTPSEKHPHFDNAVEALMALGEKKTVAQNYVKTAINGDMSMLLADIVKKALGMKQIVQRAAEAGDKARQAARVPTTTPAQAEPPKVTILPSAEPAPKPQAASQAPRATQPSTAPQPPSGVPQGTPRAAQPSKPKPVPAKLPVEVRTLLTEFQAFSSPFQHGNTVRQGVTYVNKAGYILQQKGFAKWYIYNPGKVYVGSTQDEREAVRLIIKDYNDSK